VQSGDVFHGFVSGVVAFAIVIVVQATNVVRMTADESERARLSGGEVEGTKI
jgi:sorbitol-specific phosphotransferase system component IIC